MTELVRDTQGSDEARQRLALLTIAEMGTRTSLTKAPDLRPLLLVSA